MVLPGGIQVTPNTLIHVEPIGGEASAQGGVTITTRVIEKNVLQCARTVHACQQHSQIVVIIDTPLLKPESFPKETQRYPTGGTYPACGAASHGWALSMGGTARSEERRVGKECRAWWS